MSDITKNFIYDLLFVTIILIGFIIIYFIAYLTGLDEGAVRSTQYLIDNDLICWECWEDFNSKEI